MSTLPDDVQPPEFIANSVHGRRVQKVPFLYQREGEVWEDFMDRMARVSRSLNNEPDDRMSLLRLAMFGLFGLAIWGGICLLIWRFLW